MQTIDPATAVIVFDLDDTLYSEYEYKTSGIRAAAGLIGRLYPEFETQRLLSEINPQDNDWLDKLCRLCRFNDDEKKSLLWHYRLHRPTLTLYCRVEELAAFTRRFAACALITDGRSLTQHLKLEALGITGLFDDILISEATGHEKPDEGRFRFLEKKYGRDKQYIYIGDNIKKDFAAPKKLGWFTIGVHPAPMNIHRHNPADFGAEFHPHLWIPSVRELVGGKTA